MVDFNFDTVIIGGGPGGYVAAIRLAQLGQKVALVEKEHLGGICLNWGCIPTKALLTSAELYYKLKHSGSEFGVQTTGIAFDLHKAVERSRTISAKLTGGIKSLLNKHKITIINGIAKIDEPNKVSIDNQQQIHTKDIIISTGASPRILPGFEPSARIWTYREALVPTQVPSSMIIVGSGAIGIEFASFYNSIGCSVTVLEAQNSILPTEDNEISTIAQKSFETRGIKFKTNIKLIKQQSDAQAVRLTYEVNGQQETISAEILIMAVGIVGNTSNIGLDKTKIICVNNHIITNELMQTAEKGIYAIGDVAGAPWLAHKASHEGIIAAETIAGKKAHPISTLNIPSCIYSTPQIASIGLTEEAALKQGYQIKVGRFPAYANGKALISGSSDGLVKTIFDAKTGELLGAHMIGHDVTELIQGYAIAKGMEGTELDLMHTIFPHPTLSEMMHESALQAYGLQIHI